MNEENTEDPRADIAALSQLFHDHAKTLQNDLGVSTERMVEAAQAFALSASVQHFGGPTTAEWLLRQAQRMAADAGDALGDAERN